jgi:hypothetical protein
MSPRIINKAITFCVMLLALSSCATAAGKRYPEKYYQDAWCKKYNGKTEVVLSDGSRCDCLTDEYATEVEFAHKWAEAVGQSLHYAALTGKKAKVLLIMRSKKDRKYYERLQQTIRAWGLAIVVEQK